MVNTSQSSIEKNNEHFTIQNIHADRIVIFTVPSIKQALIDV